MISFLSRGGGINSVAFSSLGIGAGVEEEPEGWAEISGAAARAVSDPRKGTASLGDFFPSAEDDIAEEERTADVSA